jgi:hypothetical protein
VRASTLSDPERSKSADGKRCAARRQEVVRRTDHPGRVIDERIDATK